MTVLHTVVYLRGCILVPCHSLTSLVIPVNTLAHRVHTKTSIPYTQEHSAAMPNIAQVFEKNLDIVTYLPWKGKQQNSSNWVSRTTSAYM